MWIIGSKNINMRGIMIKFPYGISDFKNIVTEGYYYCGRTDKIPLLENAKSQLFIRPRRFGKSLLLSMPENYFSRHFCLNRDSFDGMIRAKKGD